MKPHFRFPWGIINACRPKASGRHWIDRPSIGAYKVVCLCKYNYGPPQYSDQTQIFEKRLGFPLVYEFGGH
jgi:hypothetical protein